LGRLCGLIGIDGIPDSLDGQAIFGSRGVCNYRLHVDVGREHGFDLGVVNRRFAFGADFAQSDPG
jgi:hypothetical protein